MKALYVKPEAELLPGFLQEVICDSLITNEGGLPDFEEGGDYVW